MQELISIIVNAYNCEEFIEKCLDSIVNQTYTNLEILIINDGSTDRTLENCKKYKDDRIRIISTENMGLSMSRNVGIENAKGEYLYFVDSDDFIEKDVIEYLYKLCKKYDVKMATCRPKEIRNYDYTLKNKKEKIEIISSKDMLKKELLSIDKAVTTWNKLIKRELFDNIRFDNRIINDICVTHKIVIEAEKIAYSNQIKYFYYRHIDAVTIKNNKNIDRIKDNYIASKERFEYIKERYPNFIENDIGLLINFLRSNEELESIYGKKEITDFYNCIFRYKMLFANVKLKEKVKLLLFKISPKLYRKICEKYRKELYNY